MRASFGSDARNAIGRPMIPPVARPAAAAFFQSHCFRPASSQQCVNWYLCQTGRASADTHSGSLVSRTDHAHVITLTRSKDCVDLRGRLVGNKESDTTRGHLQAKKCSESTAICYEVAPDMTRQTLAAEVILPTIVAGGEETPHASDYAPAHRPVCCVRSAGAVLAGSSRHEPSVF